MNALEDWEFRMMELEEKLQPIAKRPVDITRPDWLERLQAGVQPLDEAGVRDAAERLLAELIGAYAQGTDHTRAAIRRLFREYRSLAWAATLSVPRTTIDGLRQHLILFSITDQGRDSRDALLTLQGRLKAAGCEVTDIVDHGIIRSVYFTDPNGIALEASWWTLDATGRAADYRDERFFADPDPVAAVKEIRETGAVRSVPHTHLV